MAVQARQVFYVQDPSDSRWSVFVQGRKFSMSDYSDGSSVDVSDMPIACQQMPIINGIDHDDVVHATRNDHHKGLWENNHT